MVALYGVYYPPDIGGVHECAIPALDRTRQSYSHLFYRHGVAQEGTKFSAVERGSKLENRWISRNINASGAIGLNATRFKGTNIFRRKGDPAATFSRGLAVSKLEKLSKQGMMTTLRIAVIRSLGSLTVSEDIFTIIYYNLSNPKHEWLLFLLRGYMYVCVTG